MPSFFKQLSRPIRYLSLLGLIIVLTVNLVGCHKSEDPHAITVGIIDGPETALWEIAQRHAQQEGLHIKLVMFSDYMMPNAALNNGDIDANAFQHQPFLEAQIHSRGYALQSVAKTFIFPMGMYSQKIQALKDLPKGAIIAIPNDPSNEARALQLLQQGGLIALRQGANTDATPMDITHNTKHLRFQEMDAALLPRVLPDVTAAVITDDFAQPAGLNPHNALLTEGPDSPYMNIIVVRKQSLKDPIMKKKIEAMVKAFQTPAVIAKAKALSHGTAIAGWHTGA